MGPKYRPAYFRKVHFAFQRMAECSRRRNWRAVGRAIISETDLGQTRNIKPNRRESKIFAKVLVISYFFVELMVLVRMQFPFGIFCWGFFFSVIFYFWLFFNFSSFFFWLFLLFGYFSFWSLLVFVTSSFSLFLLFDYFFFLPFLLF